MWFVRRIVGDSMLPTLRPGSVVIVRRQRRVRPGDIVVFSHDGLEKIKRITGQDGEAVYVRGDNPGKSTDSRHFGWVDTASVRGVIIWPKRSKKKGAV